MLLKACSPCVSITGCSRRGFYVQRSNLVTLHRHSACPHRYVLAKRYQCLSASSTHEPYIAAFTPCSQAFAPIRMTSCGKDRKHRSLLPKPCGKARPCRRTASSSCQGKFKRAHDERAHFDEQRDNTRHASAETLKASNKPAQDAGAWSVR